MAHEIRRDRKWKMKRKEEEKENSGCETLRNMKNIGNEKY